MSETCPKCGASLTARYDDEGEDEIPDKQKGVSLNYACESYELVPMFDETEVERRFRQSDRCRIAELESALAAATKRAEEAEAKHLAIFQAHAEFDKHLLAMMTDDPGAWDGHDPMSDCIEVIAKLRSDLNAEAMKDGGELVAKLAAAEQENARLRQGIAWLECDIRTADLAQLPEQCDEWEAYAAALLSQSAEASDGE